MIDEFQKAIRSAFEQNEPVLSARQTLDAVLKLQGLRLDKDEKSLLRILDDERVGFLENWSYDLVTRKLDLFLKMCPVLNSIDVTIKIGET